MCVFSEHLHEQMTTPSLRRVYQVLNSIMGQIRGFIREPDVLASLDKFQQRLKGDEAKPRRVMWTSLNRSRAEMSTKPSDFI